MSGGERVNPKLSRRQPADAMHVPAEIKLQLHETTFQHTDFSVMSAADDNSTILTTDASQLSNTYNVGGSNIFQASSIEVVEQSTITGLDADNISVSTGGTGDISKLAKIKEGNPNLHLLHNGVWLKPMYEVGRLMANTNEWSCCGEFEHYSLYCSSIKRRYDYAKAIADGNQFKIDEVITKNRRKEELENHIANAKKVDVFLKEELTIEEQALKDVCSSDNNFNAPILIEMLISRYQEEPTLLQGLAFVWKQLQTGDGCYMMQRHNCMKAFLKVYKYYLNPMHPPVQLQLLQIFRKLLECNYTRVGMVKRYPELLMIVFQLSHYHMNSLPHVENAVGCLLQFSRFEKYCHEITKNNIIPYVVLFVKKFCSSIPLVKSAIKLFDWVSANSKHRLEYVCYSKAVQCTLTCIIKHSKEQDVLGPAMSFLLQAASGNPPSLELILKYQCVPNIIQSLKAVYDQDVTQLEGLKLLQLISKTSEGWKQISETKGGWQSICQGTRIGDALVHALKGNTDFHNPGWAIGETPNIEYMDRKKAAAQKGAITSLESMPSASWTTFSLREFMGLSLTGQTLSINTDEQDIYFELVTTLDLLPKPREGREDWFQRVKIYEGENEVQLEDMVQTMIDMKRSAHINQKLSNAGKIDMNTVNRTALSSKGGAVDEAFNGHTKKELYVLGNRFTTESMAEGDVDLTETLAEIGIFQNELND
jgi:hypothetical protein